MRVGGTKIQVPQSGLSPEALDLGAGAEGREAETPDEHASCTYYLVLKFKKLEI